MTMAGILSGPVSLDTSRLQIVCETILAVILLELSFCSVRDGKSGSYFLRTIKGGIV